MTQHRHGLVTPYELLELASEREPKLARLSRRSGVSRHALYQIRRGRPVTFEVYGRLARFVLGSESGG